MASPLVTDNMTIMAPAYPEQLLDPKKTRAMIVKELNEISINEREKAYHDIHGVSDEIDENPEFVSKSLYELQTALDKIHDKPAYNIALSQSCDYAAGRDLYLLFLRSTSFDGKAAAANIVTYFELKRFYFGDDTLGRPILYSDLNEADLECLKSGFCQPLPFRDKAGRLVFVHMLQFLPKRSAIELNRAVFYLSSVLYNNEETQKKGYVLVAMGSEALGLDRNHLEFIWRVASTTPCAPWRNVASHFCLENPLLALPVISLAQNAWETTIRIRNRVHQGTQMEWMYQLMSFGIPVKYFPLTNGGEIKNQYFREWLGQQAELERIKYHKYYNIPPPLLHHQEVVTRNLVMWPRWTDVLAGKGSLAQHYTGNLLFNQLVEDYQQHYQLERTRKGKNEITRHVWQLLQQENVRFLERNNDGFWEEVCKEEEIFNKINYRLRLKPKKKVAPPSRSSSDPHEADQASHPGVVTFLNQTAQSKDSACISFACCRASNGGNKRLKLQG